jgi:ABC-type sulfate/molybdate transport systems ATPase subunit
VIRRWSRPDIEKRVREMAELLGLGRLLNRKPRGLSGGEAQRVALGRALAFHPPILLLDEPLGALDEETRDEMYGLLQSIRTRTGVTTLHVTHASAEARRLADQLLILRDGKIQDTRLEKPGGDGIMALGKTAIKSEAPGLDDRETAERTSLMPGEG